MRAYCRRCCLSWNIGIGTGLTTKGRASGPKCGRALFVTPGPKWRIAGRLTPPERANADRARRVTR